MAWIELHQSLFTHRKTIDAAARLDLPEVYIVGHIAAIWTWALDNAPNGVIRAASRVIERVAQWPGEKGALVATLVAVGFLREAEPEEAYEIHDWHEYAGRLIERREKNAERMKSARSASLQPEKTHVQRTCSARTGATVPNRTIPSPLPPPQPSKSVPEAKAPSVEVGEEGEPEEAGPKAPTPPHEEAGKGAPRPSAPQKAPPRGPETRREREAFIAATLAQADQDPERSHWRGALHEAVAHARPREPDRYQAHILRNWMEGESLPDPPPPRPRTLSLRELEQSYGLAPGERLGPGPLPTIVAAQKEAAKKAADGEKSCRRHAHTPGETP